MERGIADKCKREIKKWLKGVEYVLLPYTPLYARVVLPEKEKGKAGKNN